MAMLRLYAIPCALSALCMNDRSPRVRTFWHSVKCPTELNAIQSDDGVSVVGRSSVSSLSVLVPWLSTCARVAGTQMFSRVVAPLAK